MTHPSTRSSILHVSVPREIAENSNDLVFLTDSERNIIYVNPTACKKLGMKKKEFLGQRLFALFPSRLRPRYTSSITRGLRLHARWTGEAELALKEDCSLWVDAFIAPYGADRTAQAGLLFIGCDMHDRKLLAAREWTSCENAEKIIASMNDGVLLIGSDGKILSCNEAFADLVGYRTTDIIGRSLPYPWMEQGGQKNFKGIFTILRKEEKLGNYPVQWQRKGGKPLYLSLSFSLLRTPAEKSGQCCILTVRDVTNAEHGDALGRANQRIQLLVGELRRKNGTLHTLAEIHRLMLDGGSTTKIFQRLIAGVKKLVSHDLAGIYVHNQETRCFEPHVLSHQTSFSRTLSKFSLSYGEGIIGAAAISGKMVLANNAQMDPRSKYPPGMRPELEHFVAVPLKKGTQTFGILVVGRHRNPEFLEDEAQLVKSFADAAMVALQRST